MPPTGATNGPWEAMYTQRGIRYFRRYPVPKELLRKRNFVGW